MADSIAFDPLPPTAAALAADGWVVPSGSSFLSHVGPVWMKADGAGRRFGFTVDARHDNTQERSHGGMIMTLCDDGMGHTAQAARSGERLFTVSFECQFISGARQGDFVEAHCEVVKATRSLVFMRSTCFVGDRVVAMATGIWKVLSK